jgi:hypothetical protein
MGVEGDGSQTLKSWGNGRNRKDACEQAKKNAVKEVLFKGIIHGRSGCEQRPLVPEVNAEMKYENFFNSFFTKLAGSPTLQEQIESGLSEEEIRATWQDSLEKFKKMREDYLLYP